MNHSQASKEEAEKEFKKNIKDLHDNGFCIENRRYTFAKMPFIKGMKINAFYTVVQGDILNDSVAFSDTPKFLDEIFPLLMQYTMIDGFKLDTVPEHFEEFTCDWNEFLIKSITGLASPFFSGSGTNSHSTAPEKTQVLSRKRT